MLKKGVISLSLLAGLSVAGSAQILYTSGTYVQNFDSLPTSAAPVDLAWVNNTTLLGWYYQTGGTNPRYRTHNGADSTGALTNVGANNSTERALGTLASGAQTPNRLGFRIRNNTSTIMTSFSVSFRGEQWKRGSATTQTWDCSYSLVATDLVTGAYTDVNELDMVSPNASPAGTLNGNLAINQVNLSHTVNGILWLPGTDLWIKWSSADLSGTDHIMALDDVNFSAVPEPGSILAIGAGFGMLAIRRRRRKA